jgi:hypothetical protein
MASSGSTRKITVNQLLGSGGTATLASATITGDLTVRTNGLVVNSNGASLSNTTPLSGVDSGLLVGAVGTSKAIAISMFNCLARLRERDAVNNFAITTNINATGTLDDNTRSSWKIRIGSGNDNYVLQRAAIGSSTFNDLLAIDSGGVCVWSDGAGGTRMTLNSTGLGIGATPAERLTIGSTTAANYIKLTNSGATTGFLIGSFNTSVDIKNREAGAMNFFTSDTQRMTLDASGRLLVGPTSANASGGILQLSSGITFPATQVASSDVNTLDDYEEGSWTPTITAGSGTPTTTSINTAKYTKIGRLVTLEVDISITAIGTASGVLNFTVPTGFNQSTDGNVGALREVGATASMGQIFYTAPTTVGMAIYNNATVWVNGYRVRGTYTYTV